MTCADARDIILSADHDALRDRNDPVLRRHLEQCAECAAAASHVVADVHRLRAALIARGSRAVARPRPSRVKRVAMTLVPVALAAELAMFAFLGSSGTPAPMVTQRPVLDDSVPAAVPPVVTEIDTGDVAVAEPVAKRTAAAPKRDSSSRRDSIISAASASVVSVAPRARQQYAVIATSNPKITVVWLTKGDTL